MPDRAGRAGTDTRARVVILAGPSGSGKSRLAARLRDTHGWPIVRLDDFYRDHDQPEMPREESLGIIDWDHVDSWDGPGAIAALERLVTTGHTPTPVYDISQSKAVDASEITCGSDDLILAEGIFAAELIGPLRDRGLLRAAYCIRHRHRLLTFAFRLVRDLVERRKPPLVLIRRGWTLQRAEPALVRHLTALGAVPMRASEVERELGAGAG